MSVSVLEKAVGSKSYKKTASANCFAGLLCTIERRKWKKEGNRNSASGHVRVQFSRKVAFPFSSDRRCFRTSLLLYLYFSRHQDSSRT